MRPSPRRGFTIVELVIVIAVITILAVVLVPTFSHVINNAKNSVAIQKAKTAHTQYMIDHGTDEPSEYFLYETEEGLVVALRNGGAVGVYETRKAALEAMMDNPTQSALIDTGDGKLFKYQESPATETKIEWEIGAIYEVNGEFYKDWIWRISTSFIYLSKGVTISSKDEYAVFCVFYYDKDLNYIEGNEDNPMYSITIAPQENTYIRIMAYDRSNLYQEIPLNYSENISITPLS